MKYRLRWTEQAVEQLAAIAEFISISSPVYAEQTVERVAQRFDQACRFPESGWVVPEFERADIRELIEPPYRLIVGLAPDGDYLPMLWDTFRHSNPRTHWIDFKYQRGRSPWGLNKRVALEKATLAGLLQAYEQATGLVIMPLPDPGSSERATSARRSTPR